MKEIVFTHDWVTGFGWENTVFQPEDFVLVELFGDPANNEQVYIATNALDGKHILKGPIPQ